MFPRVLISAAVLSALLSPVAIGAQAGNRIIDLHLNAEAQGRSVAASVLEGTAFRITYHGVGTFELVPVVLDEARGTLRVTVYSGSEEASTDQLRQVETVEARVGVPVRLRSMPSTGLVIDGVQKPREATGAGRVSFALSPDAFTDSCCVQCGNITACGCRVEHSCNSCCRAPCCPLVEPTSTDASTAARSVLATAEAKGCGPPIRDEERLFTAPVRVEKR